MPEAINLAEKLSKFSEHWSPKTVSKFNGHDIMVVKVKGEFNWHSHEDTDDFFMVLSGRIRIETENGNVELGPGEQPRPPASAKTRSAFTRRPECCRKSRATDAGTGSSRRV